MQTVLTSSGSKKLTKIENLLNERSNYYHILIIELKSLHNRKIDLINSYKNTVKDIDKLIEIEKRKNARQK